MKRGAILDRALDPFLLDTALDIAVQEDSLEERVARLNAVLHRTIESEAARKKVHTVLRRVWLDPPAGTSVLIQWAANECNRWEDHRPMHLGALLATHPFFADVCAITGRQLSLNGEFPTNDLKRRLRDEWGDREIVDVSARGAVRTLRSFGVIARAPGQHKSTLGSKLPVDRDLHGWLVHALLLARDVKEIDSREIAKSPELFMFQLPSEIPNGYPYLERFNEGGGRVILQRSEDS